VQIKRPHRSSGVQPHSDPRHPLVSVEPESAGRCGVLVVDHDRDEAIGNYRAGLVPIDTLANHREGLAPGGRMVIGMAADGAVLNLSTSVHSRRGDGRLPGLLATEIRRPPLS